MGLPLILGCLWVVAAALTATLPMRWQMVPGLTLLIAAPVLLVWIGMTNGLWLTLIGLFAFLSMFRRPLVHLWRKATGSAAPTAPATGPDTSAPRPTDPDARVGLVQDTGPTTGRGA